MVFVSDNGLLTPRKIFQKVLKLNFLIIYQKINEHDSYPKELLKNYKKFRHLNIKMITDTR